MLADIGGVGSNNVNMASNKSENDSVSHGWMTLSKEG